MKTNPTKLHKRAGYTLIEVSIAAGVLGVLLLSTMSATKSAQDVYETARRPSALETRVERALNRIVGELSLAGNANLSAAIVGTFGCAEVAFRTPTGIVANVVQWSDATRIRLELSPEDADNGVDDDNDGMIDERRIVLVRAEGTADEQTVIIATNVAENAQGELPSNLVDDNANGVTDEAGLSFMRNNRGLTVRLTMGARDANGRVILRSASTSITLRND
jgi:prepilin-type N-terminal cleavage/methylation domain-containing protein